MLQKLLPRNVAIAFVALSAFGATACVHQDAPGVGLVKFDSSAVFGIAPQDKPDVPDFSLPLGTDFNLPALPTVRPDLNKIDEGPCPAAKLTAFPKTSATVRVQGQPTEGLYKWKRDLVEAKGANKVTSLPFVLEGRAIRRITKDSDHQFSFEMVAPDSFVPGDTIITGFRVNTNPKLEVDRSVAARTIGVVNVPGADVRVADPTDAPGIFITSIDVQNDKGTRVSSFHPVQPMLIAPLEGGILRSGQEFRSIGIDELSGAAILNDGVVGRTSRIDACGEIVEGYAVSLHQILTSDIQSTLGDDPTGTVLNAGDRQETREVGYTFATQYGALPISETLSLGDFEADATAALGKWELGALTPSPLPDSVK
ncbi:MAG TPA: hypothetical protein VHC63_10860 [Acidimicrobiales bacterium]|nr:hypothetical protein [Acidimicrobiales bacterium]